MNKYTLKEVVMKLVGEIDPIGETNQDSLRFDNLKEMIEMVDQLLGSIDYVSELNKDRDEASMKKAGEYAHKFLLEIGWESK